MNIHPGKILLRPRITEKSALLNESSNVYTFEIANTATKTTVARAIKDLYKITPQKVNIVKLPQKKVFSRGKKGTTKAVIKAYVYLNKGDKIEIA